MGLDIRKPIGVLFVILGVQLAAWGYLGGDRLTHRTFGVNVNLWWGALLGAAGGASLGLSSRSRR
jgi:drug/metabolite transporter (DMT)-like permease